jgi:hypothetical protein
VVVTRRQLVCMQLCEDVAAKSAPHRESSSPQVRTHASSHYSLIMMYTMFKIHVYGALPNSQKSNECLTRHEDGALLMRPGIFLARDGGSPDVLHPDIPPGRASRGGLH